MAAGAVLYWGRLGGYWGRKEGMKMTPESNVESKRKEKRRQDATRQGKKIIKCLTHSVCSLISSSSSPSYASYSKCHIWSHFIFLLFSASPFLHPHFFIPLPVHPHFFIPISTLPLYCNTPLSNINPSLT